MGTKAMRMAGIIPIISVFWLLSGMAGAPRANAQLASAPSGIEGAWQGTLEVSGAKLRIVFHIAQAAGGTLSATMDSPDQGAQGIPVDAPTFAGGALHLELKTLGGGYDGKIKADHSAIEGTWKQGGVSLPLLLQPAPAAPAPGTAPATPAAPAPDFKKSTSSDPADIRGRWMGKLSYSGMELRLVVKVAADSTGALRSTLDSPDQGASNIPIDETSFRDGHLHLGVKKIGGGLEGDLSEDKTAISATWSQGGISLPLELKKTDADIVFNRPQEPKPPFPYDAREVSYVNKSAGDTLAGTLTLPRSAGPFPAVLLITGSGAQNRDEELMGHKPFLVLADDLTRRGIAVLRVDDRGVGRSTGRFRGATSADFLADVLAGIEHLKTVKEVDPHRIGLIGHSEGGLIAPMAAARSGDVAFIVLMAGPGVRGDELLCKQQALIEKTMGVSDEVLARNGEIQKKLMAVAISPMDSAAAAARIRQIVKEETAQLSDSLKKTMEYEGSSLDASIRALLSPWMRYFLAYDPRPTLAQVKCPVLALDGDKDLQVSSAQNLPAIEDALKKGGNKDFTTKELPGLNHLFQTAATGSPSEYAKIEETISPAALNLMGEWVLAHTRPRN